MDPVSNNPPIRPNQPENTEATGSVNRANSQFSIESTGPQEAQATGETQKTSALDAAKQTIQEAMKSTQDRAKVFEHYVSSRVKDQMGNTASPAVAQRVVETLKNDPHFTGLFNQLYSEAMKAR